MKKLYLIVCLVICITTITMAQPKAIGLRLGYLSEVSYQHSFNENVFIELDLGANIWGFREMNFSPTLNFSISKPNWTPKGEWEFYAGPGLSTGYNRHGGYIYENYNNSENYFYLGLSGMFGLSYKFWFPLQVSVDFRPVLIGFATLGHKDKNGKVHGTSVYSDFYVPDYYGTHRIFYPNFGLSARYTFGR